MKHGILVKLCRFWYSREREGLGYCHRRATTIPTSNSERPVVYYLSVNWKSSALLLCAYKFLIFLQWYSGVFSFYFLKDTHTQKRPRKKRQPPSSTGTLFFWKERSLTSSARYVYTTHNSIVQESLYRLCVCRWTFIYYRVGIKEKQKKRIWIRFRVYIISLWAIKIITDMFDGI